MRKKTTRRAASQAERITWSLSPPRGLSARDWVQVHYLLMIIANHYPHACPGQIVLASYMGCSVRTVQRYTRLAVKAGLLEVVPDSGLPEEYHSQFRTNTYVLRYLPRTTPVSPGPDDTSVVQSPSTYGTSTTEVQNPSGSELEEENGAAPSAQPKLADVIPLRPRGEVVPSDDIGTETFDEPKERSVPGRREPPARRIVRYFEEAWATAVAARPEFAKIKALEVGAAVGYVQTTFLRPASGKPRSEEEVEKMIDAFIAAVRMESARIKPGQSAWQRFTGWWGRQKSPPGVHDYSDAYERYRRTPPKA